MKNLLMLVLVLFGVSCVVSAQSYKPHFFDKKTSSLYLGVGVIPTFNKDKANIIVPPSSFGYENRFSERMSVGARLGYSSSLVNNENEGNYFSDLYFSSVRLGVHCNMYENWDVYGGGALAMFHSVLRAEDPAVGISKQILDARKINGRTNVSWMAFVGAKYALCNGLYLYGEVSYGISVGTIGIGFKL